jgi:type IV pilus assembly protein PilB
MRERSKKRLGEILIEDGVLTPENLEEALLHQKKDGGIIGQILIRLGYVTEENLTAALSRQLNIPYLPVANYAVNMDSIRSYRYDYCKQNMLIVFDQDDRYVYVVTADPLNDIAIDHIEKNSGKRAQVFISTLSEIMNMLDLAFAQEPGKNKP